eukprot:TRINITY_DN544_c6_g1_i1.p1 TRINITY_DN544_c6_g1~~TRINITY_DN544_c6_g1_i1.p1  ORF type:complete len:300 (-),score=79.59 TRINITY_DN544_c6_g1_i1:68-895(-)
MDRELADIINDQKRRARSGRGNRRGVRNAATVSNRAAGIRSRLGLKRAAPARAERPVEQPASITVDNLDFNVIENDLRAVFRDFGPILSAKLVKDKNGHSLGIAEVIFKQREKAVAALRKYNGVTLDGRPMKITLSNIAPISVSRSSSSASSSSSSSSPRRSVGRVAVRAGGRGVVGVVGRGLRAGTVARTAASAAAALSFLAGLDRARSRFAAPGARRRRAAASKRSKNSNIQNQNQNEQRAPQRRRGQRQQEKNKPLTKEQADAALDGYMEEK